MASNRNPGVLVGLILVLVGLWWLAAQLIEGLTGEGIPLLVGLAFLGAYFYTGGYGLLVAGGIVTGVGFGQVVEAMTDAPGDLGSVGLGLGFLSIYVIDRLRTGDSHWWPLIPGGILLVTGLASLGEPFSRAMDYVWPAVLIIIGLVLIFGVAGVRRRS